MALTPKQAWAIAHLVAELRTDWQPEGVVAALKKCADKSPTFVALAAIRAAADSNVRTPGAIPGAGDHWQEGIKSQPRTSYDTPCSEHPDQIHPCPRCKAATTAPSSEHLTRMRAELQSARSNLCSHGVPPERCSDHREQPAIETAEETTDA